MFVNAINEAIKFAIGTKTALLQIIMPYTIFHMTKNPTKFSISNTHFGIFVNFIGAHLKFQQ